MRKEDGQVFFFHLVYMHKVLTHTHMHLRYEDFFF